MNKIFLGIFVIIIIIFFINNTDKNDIKLYDKIYFINLEKRKDRYYRFNNTFKNSDITMDYELFKAIDGKKIDISQYVTEDTLEEINYIEKYKKRKYHYQLTKGAIGCYLSHVNIWKDILDNNIESALILEDDANLPSNFSNLLNYYIKDIPSDYDIILLGCKCLDCENYKKYRKVNRFWLTHSYIITKKCIEKIYDKMFPIKQQIDSELSDLSDIINIYALKQNIISQYSSKSDIQIPIINNVESFKNYHA